MTTIQDSVSKLLTKVTKSFVHAKRMARDDRLSDEQIRRLRERDRVKAEGNAIKTAAWSVMPKAYMLASDNGSLPANARQIMYAARPLVLAMTGGKCWKDSAYFTQTLLPNYQTEHAEDCADWDVVYDARGHLVEPHVRMRFGLGTLDVRRYLKSWTNSDPVDDVTLSIDELCRTSGPHNRYRFALFIEKEGFDSLLERSRIAEKFDLMIFSSKGMSVTAARLLVDELSQAGVTILVVHDFDVDGLVIMHTLGHDTRRYTFKVAPNVIDIGLSLEDVEEMGLQSEPVVYKQQKDPGTKLYEYEGVTGEEIDFLVEERVGYTNRWKGKRVELNAMTSRQLIAWLERKFEEHGVEKVVPGQKTLASAWHRARKLAALKKAIAKVNPDRSKVPPRLGKRVQRLLNEIPWLSWDRALIRLAEEEK